MKLPFLRNTKWPRIAPPPEEKIISGTLEDHCFHELSDAIAAKDIKLFRQALEALILNCFESGGDDAATSGI